MDDSTRSQRCACGGTIHNRYDSAIAFDVAQHNASVTHLIWRRGQETTVERIPGDMSPEEGDASSPALWSDLEDHFCKEGYYHPAGLARVCNGYTGYVHGRREN